MQLNQAGIELIKSHEGCKLKAYPDPATGGKPYTIGYGHTGPEVKPGLVWTQAQAEECFDNDVQHCASRVRNLVKIALTDNEFSALVCLAYNIGIANLAGSTLLKLVNEGLSNDAAIERVADEFLKWNKAAGKVMAGLTSRRQAEARLFTT